MARWVSAAVRIIANCYTHLPLFTVHQNSILVGNLITREEYPFKNKDRLPTSYSFRNMASCCTEILRSVSLNSYGIFQPSGPNLHLSWINAWKKHRPNSILFHALWTSKYKQMFNCFWRQLIIIVNTKLSDTKNDKFKLFLWNTKHKRNNRKLTYVLSQFSKSRMQVLRL